MTVIFSTALQRQKMFPGSYASILSIKMEPSVFEENVKSYDLADLTNLLHF